MKSPASSIASASSRYSYCEFTCFKMALLLLCLWSCRDFILGRKFRCFLRIWRNDFTLWCVIVVVVCDSGGWTDDCGVYVCIPLYVMVNPFLNVLQPLCWPFNFFYCESLVFRMTGPPVHAVIYWSVHYKVFEISSSELLPSSSSISNSLDNSSLSFIVHYQIVFFGYWNNKSSGSHFYFEQNIRL